MADILELDKDEERHVRVRDPMRRRLNDLAIAGVFNTPEMLGALGDAQHAVANPDVSDADALGCVEALEKAAKILEKVQ